MNKFIRITIFLGLALISACTVKIPDIKVTGEKTALENQILGEYNKVKEDAWMISSERGEGKVLIPKDKKEIIEAVRNREFNKDDVDELKTMGLFGEKPDGLLGIADSSIAMTEHDQKLVDKIFFEENRDRTLIMQRIAQISTDLESAAPAAIAKAFFEMNLDESPKGTPYINDKGKWEKK